MKQEFIDFLNALIAAAPEVAEAHMTDGVRTYMETLMDNKNDKADITDKGKVILKYLQENQETKTWTSKAIAEGLFMNSRAISGTMRGLVSANFCEKLGAEPVIYALTEKGKNYIID